MAFLDWPGVRQVIRLERDVCHSLTGRQTIDVAYAITSCSPAQASARRRFSAQIDAQLLAA